MRIDSFACRRLIVFSEGGRDIRRSADARPPSLARVQQLVERVEEAEPADERFELRLVTRGQELRTASRRLDIVQSDLNPHGHDARLNGRRPRNIRRSAYIEARASARPCVTDLTEAGPVIGRSTTSILL
jgi:hypothetical protein